jgi:serine/threonine protein kinase
MTIAEAKQFGPYRLIEKIGSGGMGEVYRALDTRLEREVALKLVSDSYLGVADTPSPASTPSPGSGSHHSNERFLREARSAATLNHPHVCSIYDTGEQDGRPYLVMELLHGETLKQYLANQAGKGLSPDEVIRFSQEAASALAAAHRKGIIHRDIKPANLFVLEEERGKRVIKILDFGLAKKQSNPALAQSETYGVPPGSSSDATAAASMELTARCPDRSVQPGLGDLRDGYGEGAVRWSLRSRDICRAAHGDSCAGQHGESGDAEEA